MPGYANWKQLYKEEYLQLYEEGYPVGGNPQPDLQSEYLPIPEEQRNKQVEETISEDIWKQAYWNLWKVREKGLRKDFPYNEPNEFKSIINQAGYLPQLSKLDMNEYAERIKGAWYGRCAAVILGKPLEVGMNRLQIKEYLESVDSYPLNEWVPIYSKKLNKTLRMDCLPSAKGHVKYVQPDDDIHYTILALLLAENKGLDFTNLDVGMNWLDNVPYHWFWCAARQAYYHLVNLTDERSQEEQVAEIPLKINPWRECIDGQLRGDFWGYITPSEPRKGAKLAHQECSLSLVKNGLYGGMFVAACVSAALAKNPSIETIIKGGLSVIPGYSRLAEAIKNVIKWYESAGDWIFVCDQIYNKYGHLPFAATINNLAMVVLSLIHGDLNFTKTITTAVMCGIDTDCNSATAGSIVGAAIGYDGLDERWISPLNDKVKTAVAGFGEGQISELVQRTLDIYIQNVPKEQS